MPTHTQTTLIAIATSMAASLATVSAQAGVSPEQAAQLGKTLTPMGAEMAGNADGSIPPWNPEGTPVAADFVPGSNNYVNPYPDEKPLYTINASNWKEHADYLTPGTQAMFEKYGADGWEMHVYPSHRGTVRPDWFYANTLKNATDASLVAEGQKIEGNYPGVPFPTPVRTGGDVEPYDSLRRRRLANLRHLLCRLQRHTHPRHLGLFDLGFSHVQDPR